LLEKTALIIFFSDFSVLPNAAGPVKTRSHQQAHEKKKVWDWTDPDRLGGGL